MERREFLKRGLAVVAGTAMAGSAAPVFGQAGPEAPPGIHRLTGRVVLRGQPDYDDARQGFNARISHSPAVIVFCRSAADVARAVQWAREYHVPIRARCGRHCYEGYSSVDDGIVVDVSALRRVRLAADRRTVRVGAGIKLLDLYETLWRDGMTVPGGSCPTVGIAGLTLGGGYGLLARHLGLTCDSLLEAEIVTPDARIVHASATRHSDLLWACRGGGGGNFGVVTSFTFRVHPVDQVAIYNIVWNWDALDSVLDAWQSWAPTVDGRLTSILKLRAESYGTVSSVGQFVGPAAELSALLEPLRAVGTPREFSVETVSYMDAVRIFAGLKSDHPHWPAAWHSTHTQFKNTSDYANRPLSPEARHTLRHFLSEAPESGNLVQLEAYGGAISRIAPDATAFPHRVGPLFNLQYQAYWKQDAAGPPNMAWVAQFRQAMRPFVSGGAYGNYCDADIVNWLQAYYGANAARLARIKAKYDPHDLFQFPQSIRPSGR